MLNVSSSSLVVFVFAILAGGCASATDVEVNGSNNDGEDEGALETAASELVGRYESERTTPGVAFQSLTLHADRTFEAFVDTGIRCVAAPCNGAGAWLVGKFKATSKTLTLTAGEGEEASKYYGRYRFTKTANGILLSGAKWSQSGDWEDPLKKAEGIWSEDVTKIEGETKGGGFMRPAPAGSECTMGAEQYSLDLASRDLTFVTCKTSQSPYKKQNGSKRLTPAAVRTIVETVKAASIVTDRDGCGADKPFKTVSLTTPAGSKTYQDSFHACAGRTGTFIYEIDAIVSAMRDAAK